MTSPSSPQSKDQHLRSVYVVETYLKSHRRWFVWSPHQTRGVAWMHARHARKEIPGEKFRVTAYVSTKQ